MKGKLDEVLEGGEFMISDTGREKIFKSVCREIGHCAGRPNLGIASSEVQEKRLRGRIAGRRSTIAGKQRRKEESLEEPEIGPGEDWAPEFRSSRGPTIFVVSNLCLVNASLPL